MYLCFILTCLAKHFNHFRLGAFITIAPLGHFKQDFVIVLCLSYIFLINKEVLIYFFKIRNYKGETIGRHLEPSYKAGAISLDDFFYFSLRLLACPIRGDGDSYRISMQGRT